MADVVSNLIVRLMDMVSGPARQAANSLRGLKGAANALNGTSFTGRLDTSIARTRARMAELRGEMLDAVAVGYAIARAIDAPIRAATEWETRLEDIGQKADLSKDAQARLGAQIRRLAPEVRRLSSELAAGVDTLVGLGAAPDVAVSMIRPIARTATAYRASVTDLANAGYAAVDNLKVPAAQLQFALDAMAKSGKEGAFELKDMAKDFPALTAAASALKMQGVPAVADLAAALQVARKGAADGSTAANNMANFMQKIVSKETMKNFQGFGVNVVKELEYAQKKGLSPVEHMLKVLDKVTKGGKAELVAKIFGDKQVLEFIRPLMANMKEYQRIRAEALKASGMTEEDFAKRLQTSQSKFDAFAVAMENLKISLGTSLLPMVTDLVNRLTGLADRVGELAEKYPALTRAIVGTVGALVALRLAALGFAFFGNFLKLAVLSLVRVFAALGWAILPVVAALGAVAAAGLWIRNNWQGLGTFFESFGQSFRKNLGPEAAAVVDGIVAKVSGLWDWLNRLLGPIDEGGSKWRSWGEAAGAAAAGVVNWFARIDEKLVALGLSIVMYGARWKVQIEQIGTDFAAALAAIPARVNALAAELYQAGANAIQALWDGIRSKIDALIAWFQGKINELSSAASGLANKLSFGLVGTPKGGGAAPAAPAGPATSGQRASGGPVSGGSAYLVGERGPEIFRPDRAGSIVPNSALGGAQVSMTVNFNGRVDDPAEVEARMRQVLREEVRECFRGVFADTGLKFA